MFDILKKLIALFMLTLLLTSCSSVPFEYADYEALESSMELKAHNPAPWKKITLQTNMVIEYPFYSTSVICMMQYDGKAMHLAAMLPAGVKFMEISGTPEKPEMYYFMPGFIADKNKQQKMAEALLQDFSRIFLNERFLYPGQIPGSEIKRCTCGVVMTLPGQGEKRFYGSRKLRLMKKAVKNEDCNWQSEYFRCTVNKGMIYPDRIVYTNKTNGYRLILRVHDFQAE
ncbi:MAG: hypothetical protein J6Q81_04620 [Lentisphaeria bacterium]|nr:hypothetical protein [Lentisphaeria bacterium]